MLRQKREKNGTGICHAFNFIHSIGSESFCVVLLTTLFGELVLNPYFCNIYKIINNNKL